MARMLDTLKDNSDIMVVFDNTTDTVLFTFIDFDDFVKQMSRAKLIIKQNFSKDEILTFFQDNCSWSIIESEELWLDKHYSKDNIGNTEQYANLIDFEHKFINKNKGVKRKCKK